MNVKTEAADIVAGADQDGGGLSPAAWAVFVSPDTIGLWRLRKSLALNDARWFFDHGRMAEAAQMVSAARGSHRQIMNIVHFRRTGVRPRDTLRFAQNFQFETAMQSLKAEPPPLDIPAPMTARPPERKPRQPRENKPKVRAPSTTLSPRERQVATLIGKNLSNGEIAARLGIKAQNVAMNASNARMKLGIADRSALVEWARQNVEAAST
jgi:DNA-binding CsgD family transcriptional regulator